MQLQPPFPRALLAGAGSAPLVALAPACCADHAPPAPDTSDTRVRTRLADLDTHFLCSVIGTCLSTAALRKAMAKFIVVQGASDLDIHHDAVLMASDAGSVAKALHKALDQQHGVALQRFARVAGPDAPATLGTLWDGALQSGDVPGAYWALLTHRDTTAALRKKAFGDVHMLSHLVGAANRADIRRLVALERDNAELRERLERQHERTQELLAGRAEIIGRLQHELADARQDRAEAAARQQDAADAPALREELRAAATLVAVQAQRRERAEQAAAHAADTAARLREEMAHVREQAAALAGELAAAEYQLREMAEHPQAMLGEGNGENKGEGSAEVYGNAAAGSSGASRYSLDRALRGRRILYVGGRPSTTPAIRALVQRHGGEFQRHDGGLEDRKGLLAPAVARADLVVFPVDCVDHDSAGTLKRLCIHQGIAWLPLRSAGVGSLAAALAGLDGGNPPQRPGGAFCLKHG